MIALLTGRVEASDTNSCVVDVNGVGYLVQASTRTLSALPQAPAAVRLFVETQVREDAITLYGFLDGAERDWFRLLTTVQGVGGRVALSLLSVLSPAELVNAISAGDKASLGRASGVGARLATRLVTELRDKAGAIATGGITLPTAAPAPDGGSPASDALSALVNLGYRRPEAQAVVARIAERLGAGAGVAQIISASLKELDR